MTQHRLPEWFPRPGDLVTSTLPDVDKFKYEPERVRKRIGLVVAVLPPHVGHPYSVHQLLVSWQGPFSVNEPWSIEPDHRLKIRSRTGEDALWA